jgi:hypothetical protein
MHNVEWLLTIGKSHGCPLVYSHKLSKEPILPDPMVSSIRTELGEVAGAFRTRCKTTAWHGEEGDAGTLSGIVALAADSAC